MRRAVLLLAVAGALWGAPGAFAGGWCGTGQTAGDRTDALTAQQVHAVVAIPADGPDTFAAEAARLADDVASITTWWQGQDPTRVPRFDQAIFGANTCLDISFVRLLAPGAQYTALGANGAFQRLSAELGSGPLGNFFKKYLVYYAGPSIDDNVCGTGGGDLERGRSYAFVWLRECTDIPSDTVAAHELLHSFGALPVGARNPCPDGRGGDGHPCDSQTDVLYPYATGAPLSALVLDFNHDDYYAHAGTWADLQESLWLHRLDLGSVALTVGLSGGRGHITSDVPGLNCIAACTTQWDQNTVVRLTAVGRGSDRFVRWAGACRGTGDCELRLAQSAAANAIFGPANVALRVSVAGKGRVVCSPRCGRTFPAGDLLTLRAAPEKGWRFAGWTGVCKGRGLVCRPKTELAVTTRAVFRRR